MRRISRVIVPALGALSVVAVSEANAQTRGDEAAIHHAVDAMTTAFNLRDDKGTASVTTPDADFVTVTGNWSESTADYLAARRARFASALKNASIRVIGTKIRFVRPDVALVHVTHEIRGILNSGGKELPAHGELSLRVFVKEHGKWLMTAFHNTTLGVPTTSTVK
jgi:uncharacterized protein (TIGR02246 family)